MFSFFRKHLSDDRALPDDPNQPSTLPHQFAFENATNPENFGIVEQKIRPYHPGQVKYQGTWWTAHSSQERVLPRGTVVRIVQIEGLRAIVEPLTIS